MNLFKCFVILLLFKSLIIFGQDTIKYLDKPHSFSDILSDIQDENANEDYLIHLQEVYEDPININNYDIKNLQKIPFLSDKQIEDISYYLYRYKKIDNLSELMLIESLDKKTIRNIIPFICLDKKNKTDTNEGKLKNAFKYGRSDLCYFMSDNIPQKEGFKNDKYLGSSFQIGAKYNFKYKDNIEFGTSYEKDAGENINNGHITCYVAFHNLKKFKDINIFDFKIHFGQGLICGSGFSLGKNTSGLSPHTNTTQIRKHSSYAEYGYFRGAAVRYSINESFELTSFASHTPIQAKIVDDTIHTIYTTNYNRTRIERERLNAKIAVFGTQLSYQKGNKRISLNSIYYRYNHPYFKDFRSYNVYDFRGKENYNYSLSYKTYVFKSLFYGEIACDKNFNKACLMGSDFKINRSINCSILYRNYNKKYIANYSSSFGESSHTKNEEGLYSSFELNIIKNFRLNTYIDLYKFRGIKYRISKPSDGKDFSTRITYTHKRDSEFYLLFKYESKLRDKKNEEKENIPTPFIKYQYKLNYKRDWDKMGFKAACYLVHCEGYGKALTCSYYYKGKILCSTINSSLFKANDYDNRSYVYENSLPGTFNLSMLYKKGYKINILEKIELMDKYSIYLKANCSYIANCKYHGSGLNKTEGKLLSNIKFMLKFKF